MRRKPKHTPQVKNTSHGPVVILGEEIIFIDEFHNLASVFDDFPDILFKLNKCIIDYFNLSIGGVLESLIDRENIITMPIANSLNTINSYYRLIYSEYFMYRKHIAESNLGTTDLEALVATSSDSFNEFYNLYSKVDMNKVANYKQQYNT